jgi:hypothetical protein
MKKVYCVLCGEKHTSFAWKHKKWRTEEGEVEGWACEKWYHPHYTRIIPWRLRKQADAHKKEMLQPFLDETKPNKEFIDAYQDEVNLRDWYTDKELKTHLGPKYIETHPKEEK